MPTSPRTQRLPAFALKRLIETRPFDHDAWMRACSPALHLRIANGPVYTKRAQALAALQAFLGRIGGFGCDFCEVWQRREAIYVETELEFTDAQDRVHRIPCVLIARTTHGQLRDIRLHLDPTDIPQR